MRRMARLIITVGALCATLALGIASAQETTSKTELKTFEVLAVSGNTVVAKGPDGTKEYNLPPDFKLTMNGNPVAVSDLKPGMTVQAMITTKITKHSVVTTEVKDGTVMKVRGSSIIVKTETGYKKFTPERLKSGDVMLFRDGQEIKLTDLREGDKISAMIVTAHPPTTVTEREIQATAKEAPKKEAPAVAEAQPSAPAPAVEKTTPAPAPEPAPVEKTLPKTASPLPGVALLGILALASAAALTAIRRSRTTR